MGARNLGFPLKRAIYTTIKTEKAVKQLRWVRAEAVTKLDATLRKAEQEAFDLAFAEVLQEIVAAKE